MSTPLDPEGPLKELRAQTGRIAANGGVAVENKELSAGRRAIAAVVVDAEGRPLNEQAFRESEQGPGPFRLAVANPKGGITS